MMSSFANLEASLSDALEYGISMHIKYMNMSNLSHEEPYGISCLLLKYVMPPKPRAAISM